MPIVLLLIVDWSAIAKLCTALAKPWLEHIGKAALRLCDWSALHPITSVITSGALFGVALLSLFRYWEWSDKYTDIVGKTLCRESEPTAQRFKGLESFLLSNVQVGIDQELKKKTFTSAFIEQYEKVSRGIKQYAGWLEDPIAKKNANRVLDLKLSRGAQFGSILTDSCTKSYLFVPINTLRFMPTSDYIETLKNGPDPKDDEDKRQQYQVLIDAMVDQDDAIKRDIRLSRHLADALQPFTNITIANGMEEGRTADLQDQPTQVSLMTKNGVVRIYNARPTEIEQYYGSLFPSDQFFPSRPYFRRVFQERKVGESAPKEKDTIGSYFYVSRPYVDLGGNWIVITLARGFELEGKTKGAICFDVCLADADAMQAILEKRIQELEGQTLVVECTIVGDDVRCTLENGTRRGDLDIVQQQLKQNVDRFVRKKKAIFDRTEVFGNIQVINVPENSEGGRDESSAVKVLHAAVPIQKAEFRDNGQHGKLLLISLDLAGYRRRTAHWLMVSAVAFGIGLSPILAVAIGLGRKGG